MTIDSRCKGYYIQGNIIFQNYLSPLFHQTAAQVCLITCQNKIALFSHIQIYNHCILLYNPGMILYALYQFVLMIEEECI